MSLPHMWNSCVRWAVECLNGSVSIWRWASAGCLFNSSVCLNCRCVNDWNRPADDFTAPMQMITNSCLVGVICELGWHWCGLQMISCVLSKNEFLWGMLWEAMGNGWRRLKLSLQHFCQIHTHSNLSRVLSWVTDRCQKLYKYLVDSGVDLKKSWH